MALNYIVMDGRKNRAMEDGLADFGDYNWNGKVFVDHDTGVEVTYEDAVKLLNAQEKKQARAKKPAAKPDPELQRLQEAAKGRGFKPLTGSAKQKKWAESIRAQKTAGIADEYLVAVLGSELNSRFWIDMRGARTPEIARPLAEKMIWSRCFIETNISRQHGFDFWVVEAADASNRYSEEFGADRAAAQARKNAIDAEMSARLKEKLSRFR